MELMKKKIDTTGECHVWKGALTPDGYPRVNRQGNANRRGRRYWYEQHFGSIPEGLVVRHKCDNPLCLNIDHLELGTVEDNVQDRNIRGRTNNHCSQNLINEVHRLRAEENTYQQIADALNIKYKAVEYIMNRKLPSVA